MRLASKIFLTSSLVIIVLAGVGVLSVRAVGRLVSVNKEITTQTVPALRLTASVRDAMLSLVRLEARYLVLRDARYRTLWEEQAIGAQADLLRLRGFLTSRREKQRHDDVTAAFEQYRRVVAEQWPPSGTTAPDPGGVESEARAGRAGARGA